MVSVFVLGFFIPISFFFTLVPHSNHLTVEQERSKFHLKIDKFSGVYFLNTTSCVLVTWGFILEKTCWSSVENWSPPQGGWGVCHVLPVMGGCAGPVVLQDTEQMKKNKPNKTRSNANGQIVKKRKSKVIFLIHCIHTFFCTAKQTWFSRTN